MKDLSVEQSDIELYKSFLNGDNESFNMLVLKYRKPLVSFIMKYVSDIYIADDIAQDAFVYILINRVNYDFKYSFRTYLYTIAKSRSLNYIKQKKKLINVDDLLNEKSNFDVENQYLENEKKEIIQRAINKLKKEQQIVIYLYEFQGFKYEEISKILNCGMSKTKMLLHRARKSLHKILKEEKNDK